MLDKTIESLLYRAFLNKEIGFDDKKIVKKEGIKIMLEKMREMIAEQLSVEADTITEETSFKEDLGADSLDAVELCMTLEEEFDITIPEDKIADLKTVKDIVDYVESLA